MGEDAAVCLALGKEPKVGYEPSRSGEATCYVADITKARELLGYQPQVPLSSGLVRAVEFWCSTSRQ